MIDYLAIIEIVFWSHLCSVLLKVQCRFVVFIVDLQNSDHGSKSFLCKINCARFALARTDSIRSVSGSLLAKPPYRRASSVPIQLLAHCAVPHDSGIFINNIHIHIYLFICLNNQ